LPKRYPLGEQLGRTKTPSTDGRGAGESFLSAAYLSDKPSEKYVVPGKRLLGCLKKRDLLNSDRNDPVHLAQLGTAYLEEGRISDAIEFLEKARDREGLDSILARCLEDGDVFLFGKVAKILDVSPDPDQWIKLGDRALSLGKLHFARAAYREGGAPEKLARVERLLSEPLRDQTHLQ
jgi:tetratricopeptide (TPR) repeat protein